MKVLNHIINIIFIQIILILIFSGLYFMHKKGYSFIVISISFFYLINLLFSLIIFIQKRQYIGKTSWLVIFSIFPFIGHILFWIFGQKYKKRVSLKQYRKKRTFKYEKINKIENNIFQKQSKLSQRGMYSCDIKIYDSGHIAYKNLFKDLKKAKKFIHIQYYIIKSGEIFEEFKEILLQKSSEGVEVRFIIDDFGRWAVPWYEIQELKNNGVLIKKFGKVRFPFISSKNGYRNHRKMTIIDGEIVHTGGINISDEYASLSKKYGLWIDSQIKITGESVRSYSLLFIDDWFNVTKEKLNIKKYICEKKDKGKSEMILIEDSPEVFESIMEGSIINMIMNAKKEIILTTPYLVLTPQLFSALKISSLSGVKIKILIPGRADKKSVIIATKYFATKLMKYGVKIYVLNNILIHSKIGLFDNSYSYIGTTNLDCRSLYSQWEVIQIIKGEIIKDMRKTLNNYFKLSTKLSTKDLKNKKRLITLYVNLFSPIM